MYNMGDTTYLGQPKTMSSTITSATISRISEYCNEFKPRVIYIVFHGGEPLLAEKKVFRDIVDGIREACHNTEVRFTVQTNGTLLTEDWCLFFRDLQIQVGISIDGPEEIHNQNRVFHNERGSFSEVVRGIRLRDQYLEGGLISVVNVNMSASRFYDFLKTIKAKRLNLLLPDNHHDHLPPGMNATNGVLTSTYGDWMIDLYELWKDDRSADKPTITFFENIICIIAGYNKGDELIGNLTNGAITIETNGDIQVVDPLRICEDGFTKGTLNVLKNRIAEIENLELYIEYFFSHTRVASKCARCPILSICGGGYLGHRYSKEARFNNPSIYCSDLMKLICHIQNDVAKMVSVATNASIELMPIKYQELLASVE
jgi:uncharacterized protein